MSLVQTPVTASQVSAASGVATSTTAFSPSAGAMVVVLFTYMFGTNTTGVTFTVSDNHGNTYSQPFTALNNGGAGATYVGMATFTYGSAPGSTTVKVTASSTGAADCLITPLWYTGQASSQSGAAFASNTNGSSGTTEEILITPTQTGSFVVIAGGVAAVNVNSTAISGTTLGSSWNDAGVGNSANSGYTTSASTGGVQVNVGFTLSGTSTFGYSIAALEILPAPPSSGSAPPPRLIAPGFLAPSRIAPTLPPPPPAPFATLQGTAGLTGSGSLGATGVDIKSGQAALTGQGTLGATGTVGGAQLSGQGTLSATGTDIKHGTAGLTGSGSLVAAETMAALTGEGDLGGTGAFGGKAQLSGQGTLAITGETLGYVTGLTGSGSLVAYEQVQFAALSGTGVLGLTGLRLGYVVGLNGRGDLSIPQVTGGIVNGVGGVGTPLALPGSSQVAVAPPGSSNWQWVGTLGQVTALKYSFVYPGGCDKLSMTIMVPAAYRTQLFNPGWQVKVTRGGHQVWYGKLDEPQPSASGWNLTAVGTGQRAQDFVAYYAPGDTWPTGVPDDIINRAIGRGLPWANPGLSGNPNYSQFWLGQQFDTGSQNVAAFLNMITSRAALGWYVNSQPGGLYNQNDLNIAPLPTVHNRLLIVSTPVARTLGGDINYIVIKYQVTADNTTTNTAATYNYVAAVNQPSIDAHGEMETYIDLSDVGVQTSAQAQGVGNYVLQIYQRASFAGPFQASYGQLLNTGGTPIDPGTDQAGTMVRLILTDFGYGGEVTPQFPIDFIVGGYEWDDFTQTASITPYQNVDQSLSGLLSLENSILKPIKAA